MPIQDDGPTAVVPTTQGATSLATGCVLRVLTGPRAGATVTVDGARATRTLVGKSEACELVIPDPRVSRRHTAVEIGRGGVRLTDLASTNGTWIGAVRIYDVLIAQNETFRVGDTEVRIESLDVVPPPISSVDRFGKLIGRSSVMRRLYPTIQRLASSDVSVLVEGETGTGKEVLAEAIHEASPRQQGPFVVFDCTTVVPSLVESTLFGHERGAFTGAVASHAGVFEEADGGTLFLDEIGDLELPLQAKLLRVIERGEVRRIGGSRVTKVNVRIVAATRRDLEREIHAGRFRDDLFFRLVVSRIELPPLRRREGDVALLAETFWQSLGGRRGALSGEFIRRLEDYDWPGNVRQLRNIVMQHHALGETPSLDAKGKVASASMGADVIGDVVAQDLPFFRARDVVMQAFEQRYVARVLEKQGGHVGKAAEASGMGRRYFQRIRGRAQ